MKVGYYLDEWNEVSRIHKVQKDCYGKDYSEVVTWYCTLRNRWQHSNSIITEKEMVSWEPITEHEAKQSIIKLELKK